MTQKLKKSGWWSVVLGLTLATMVLPLRVAAQDQYQQQDDPPSRVARIGYMEGSVSFQPAGETEWVQAVPNRPMTTGDKIWADKDSRAELQLGSAVIRLSANTGFSFLNLDDHTAQIQLTSGTINIRVRRLDQNDIFEIDTPNLAFSVTQPGNYRIEASEDGTYSVVSPREGGGQATGNGQTYTLHAGQRGTFSGTDSLNADVIEITGADQFDNWSYNRDHRYDNSRSAQYLSHDVVGYEDLDDNGDWRDDSHYGHVWYPSHVEAGWAPYHQGHWDWIAPWGYTWVDDSSWGYAPFHYGRWVTVGGRWGWVAGPVEVRAVYAPALVVFIGGGGGGIGVGFGGNVGWFPLGPREVFVPSYHVSREYVNRVNISNTTVNTTTVTNVYNTTIINNRTTNTTITNVTYANRNVQGAVTVVPQRAFASAQPVARAAVKVDARQIAAAPVSARVTVAPTRESVLGAKAATANHVTAPPAAVMNRAVIAKTTPPPPPVPFAKQQQALAAHPGQPLARQEVQTLRPAAAAAPHPMVKLAPPGKPATPTMGRPANQPGNQPAPNERPGQPGNQPNAGRPGQPASNPPANQPGNRPGNQPAPNERPGQPGNQPNAGRPGQPASNQPANQPSNRPGNQPAPTPSQPNNRPDTNRPPTAQPNNRPETNQPNNRPEANRPPAAQPNNRPVPQPNQPAPSQPNNRPEANRPPAAQPNNRPEPNQPNNRPETNRPPATPPNNRPTPQNSQPEPPRPQTNRPEPTPRNTPPPAAQPNNRPEPNRNQPAPAPRPQPPAPPERQQQQQQQRTPPPAASRPTPPPPPAATKPAPQRPLTPEEKKQEEERKKREQQKPPGE